MRKLIVALALSLMLSGCTSSTTYGSCVGINGDKDPTLRYDYDTGNIIMAIIFSETIVVPVVVVLSALECPVGTK